MFSRLAAITATATLLVVPVFAQEDVVDNAPPATVTASAAMTLTLESSGDIERTSATYQCDTGEVLSVQYINAAPNFLALVPVNGETHVFATALSASGARYVSGPYEWWSSGGDGTLRDLTQDDDADPLAECTQASNPP